MLYQFYYPIVQKALVQGIEEVIISPSCDTIMFMIMWSKNWTFQTHQVTIFSRFKATVVNDPMYETEAVRTRNALKEAAMQQTA